ncbi:MAG TPA: hypothetical protein VF070_24865, partial [Streptosporangiaceae bacterium]
MGIDRPDDNETAATGLPADRAGSADQHRIPDSAYPAEVDDRAGTPDRASLPDRVCARSFRDTTVIAVETRDRAEYYTELHVTVAARSAVAEHASDARDPWDGAAARFADQWAEHERRWPSSERPAASPPDQTRPVRGAETAGVRWTPRRTRKSSGAVNASVRSSVTSSLPPCARSKLPIPDA